MTSLENYKDILQKNKWKILADVATYLSLKSSPQFLHYAHILGVRTLRHGTSQDRKGKPFVITLISQCKVCITSFLASFWHWWRSRWTERSAPGIILRFLIFSCDKTFLYLTNHNALRVLLFFPDIQIKKVKLIITLLTLSDVSFIGV